mgnify:CR=1
MQVKSIRKIRNGLYMLKTRLYEIVKNALVEHLLYTIAYDSVYVTSPSYEPYCTRLVPSLIVSLLLFIHRRLSLNRFLF